MQNVSQEWKDNQNEMLVGESEIELSLRITDPDAYEDVEAIDNGSVEFSQTNATVSGVDYDMTPTLTFEQNLWLLDGSGEVLDNVGNHTNRYLSDSICNQDKIFDRNPMIYLAFSKTHTNAIKGITIVWSTVWDEYAEEFIVTALNGSTIVSQQSVINNKSTKSIVLMDINNYDGITIEVVKWSLSYRRARIEEIVIGIDKTYNKSDLLSFSYKQSVNPLSIELPRTEMHFEIGNLDKSFDPHNIEGLSKYLVERQEVRVKYGYKLDGKTEWIDGGRVYLSEWDAPQDGLSATFKASDMIEFMKKTYYGGTYYAEGRSLYDLALDVLTDADLPTHNDGSVRWHIDESLKDIYTVAPLPIDTHANCLQLIANAGCCTISQNRTGILEIIRSELLGNPTATDYSIDYFNSFSKSNIELSKPVKDVKIGYYNYKVVSNTENEMCNAVLTIYGKQEVIIQYERTGTNLIPYIQGGRIDNAEMYSNACKLTISASGSVIITVVGNIVESTKVDTSIYNSDSGETIVIDNPLITDVGMANVVGDWTRNYYNKRMTLTSSWRADPRLDALDIVSNKNDYGTSNVLMTEVTYAYNGAFKGSGEGKVI